MTDQETAGASDPPVVPFGLESSLTGDLPDRSALDEVCIEFSSYDGCVGVARSAHAGGVIVHTYYDHYQTDSPEFARFVVTAAAALPPRVRCDGRINVSNGIGLWTAFETEAVSGVVIHHPLRDLALAVRARHRSLSDAIQPASPAAEARRWLLIDALTADVWWEPSPWLNSQRAQLLVELRAGGWPSVFAKPISVDLRYF